MPATSRQVSLRHGTACFVGARRQEARGCVRKYTPLVLLGYNAAENHLPKEEYTMANTIRVIQYGLGPIGSAMARHVLARPGLELVGAVDVDPSKAGRDAGEVIGLERKLGF